MNYSKTNAKIQIVHFGAGEIHVTVIAETSEGVIGCITESAFAMFPEGEIMHFIQSATTRITFYGDL